MTDTDSIHPDLLPPTHLECKNPWERWAPGAVGKPVIPEDLVEYWQRQWRQSLRSAIRRKITPDEKDCQIPDSEEKREDMKKLESWRKTIRGMLKSGVADEDIQDAILDATQFLSHRHPYDGCADIDSTIFHKALVGLMGKTVNMWALTALGVVAQRIVSDPDRDPNERYANHSACDVWMQLSPYGSTSWMGKMVGSAMATNIRGLQRKMPSRWWIAMARERSAELPARPIAGLRFNPKGGTTKILRLQDFVDFLSFPEHRNVRDKDGRSCDDILPMLCKIKGNDESMSELEAQWKAKIALGILQQGLLFGEPEDKISREKEIGPSGLATLAWLLSEKSFIQKKNKEDGRAPKDDSKFSYQQKRFSGFRADLQFFGRFPGEVLFRLISMTHPSIRGHHLWNGWFNDCKNSQEKEARLAGLCLGIIRNLGRPQTRVMEDFIMKIRLFSDDDNKPDNEGEKNREDDERAWCRVLWRISKETTSLSWKGMSRQEIETARCEERDQAFLMSFADDWIAAGKPEFGDKADATEGTKKMDAWKAFFSERIEEGWWPSGNAWIAQSAGHQKIGASFQQDMRRLRANLESYLLRKRSQGATKTDEEGANVGHAEFDQRRHARRSRVF